MKPKAKPIAPAAAFSFDTDKWVIGALILAFGTVWILSKFAAQISGSPSSVVSITSVGMLRIVAVIGATVTLRVSLAAPILLI